MSILSPIDSYAATSAALQPVAAYVRMSTEHQQYSTMNQMDRVKEYANRRGMTIVRVFADEGKSGLSLKGRDSLRLMISEVEAGRAQFKAILVYDISRWGRFQDADESGYYEYICKRAGIAVHYCAEQFENDGSPTSNIIKSVKRSMAGEYSRELSNKVFQGACRLIQLGFKQGGSAGYGLRRKLIDQSGATKDLLKIGEKKSLQTDRVVLTPGPPEEIEIVQQIYRRFVELNHRESEIATWLNQQGILTDLGRPWTRGTVHQVLTNEKYIGNNLYHRTSFKLKRRHVKNPEEMWVRTENAFAGIVDRDLFNRARDIIMSRARRLTDDEILSELKALLKKAGRLTGSVIHEDTSSISVSVVRSRFGSLLRAYQLIGYTPKIDVSYHSVNRFLRTKHPEIVQHVITKLASIGVAVERDPETDMVILDREISVSIVLSRCLRALSGHPRWLLRLEDVLKPDLTILARMNEANTEVKDYYLLPAIDRISESVRLCEYNHILLDAYRVDSLDLFYATSERISVEMAA